MEWRSGGVSVGGGVLVAECWWRSVVNGVLVAECWWQSVGSFTQITVEQSCVHTSVYTSRVCLSPIPAQ